MRVEDENDDLNDEAGLYHHDSSESTGRRRMRVCMKGSLVLVLGLVLLLLARAATNSSASLRSTFDSTEEEYEDEDDGIPEPSEFGIPDLPDDDIPLSHKDEQTSERESGDDDSGSNSPELGDGDSDPSDEGDAQSHESTQNDAEQTKEDNDGVDSTGEEDQDSSVDESAFVVKKSKIVRDHTSFLNNITCIPEVCNKVKRFINRPNLLKDPNAFYLVASFPGSGNTWTRAVSKSTLIVS